MLTENDGVTGGFKNEEDAIAATVDLLTKRVNEPEDTGTIGYCIGALGIALVFSWVKPGNEKYFNLEEAILADDNGPIMELVEKYAGEFELTEEWVVRLLWFGRQVIQKAYPDTQWVVNPRAHIYASGDVRLLMCLDKMDKAVVH